jgi:hypothetical protein
LAPKLYLYFLANNLAMLMFMANDTIAMLIEPLKTKGSIFSGGTLGTGKLIIKVGLNYLFIINNS